MAPFDKSINCLRKNEQKNYLPWHWRVIQNLKKNLLVVRKKTAEIWKIFTRALESLKIGTWIRYFHAKQKMYKLKTYRVVICRIIRGIDLLFQNWHKEFAEFWPEHSKVSKICTLKGAFWPKHITSELKKYRRIMFNSTENWCKGKTDFCFQKWHEKLG